MFKNSKFEKILFSHPNISPLKILRTHGYRSKDVIRKKILDATNKAIKILSTSSTPVGYFCIEEISHNYRNKIELKCGTTFNSDLFRERFAKSKFLVAFIITLGKEVDETIKKISNCSDEPLGALFLENASWLALELVLRDARSKIIKFAKNNDMQIENRMAPGYTYPSKINKKRIMWELQEQKILFGLFDKESISIRLTDSCAMLPRMSRSGIFGLKKII